MGKEKEIIKNYFLNNMQIKGLYKTDSCPNEELLCDYLLHCLSQAEEEKLKAHIFQCSYCLEQLALGGKAKSGLFHKEKTLQPATLKKAMQRLGIFESRWEKPVAFTCPYCGKRLTSSKKRWQKIIWPVLAGLAFIASFLFSRYFLQFLVLAIILALKWLIDSLNRRSLIMINRQEDKHKEENAHLKD
jgi:hypothetical protein